MRPDTAFSVACLPRRGPDQRDDLAGAHLERNAAQADHIVVGGDHIGLSMLALHRTAEIGFDDDLLPDLRRRAVREPAAVVEHGDLIAHAHHHVHMMLDQDHGGAAGADARDQLAHMRRLGDIEPGGGLVEQQQPGAPR